MSLQQLLGQSIAKIQRLNANTPDAAGGWTPTWTDIFNPIYCRIEDASAARIEQFARQQLNITHEIFTSQQGVRVGMRVVENGIAYLVQGDITERATGRIPTYCHFVAEEQKPLVPVAGVN